MRIMFFAVGLAGIFALGGCSSGSPTVVTVTQTQTATVTATTQAPPSARTTKSVPARTPTSSGKAARAETFTMPKLIGKNLQAAQDLLQSKGSYLLDEQDATSADRFQLFDRDWKVCSQKPKAGTKTKVTTVIVAKSVKLDEKCP